MYLLFIMLFTVPIQLSFFFFNYNTRRFVWINFRNIYNFIGIAKLLATFEKNPKISFFLVSPYF